MPEGDSVWRTGRRLNSGLRDRVLTRSDLRVPQHATADLSGMRVLGTETHGKHLFTRFDSAITLHTHLRMDGEWTVLGPGRRAPAGLADQVRVLLETDEQRTALALRMPVVQLMRTVAETSVTSRLGPDPLRHDWDGAEAVRRLDAEPSRPLAAALLDQRLLAGLGNLWVNELLFVRGHSPWTRAGDVDLERLVAMAARMLRQSITAPRNGQVTTGDPRPGHEHWVYGRSGLACRRCGTPIGYVDAVPGDAEQRATWWCSYCQAGPGPTGGPPPRHRVESP